MADAFKSARALGIKDWERAALVDLIEPLRSGALAVSMDRVNDAKSMARSIGGHIAHRCPEAGPSASVYDGFSRSTMLRPLFSPGAGAPNMLAHPGWNATAPEAAHAIERFLAGHGRSCWDGVFCGRHEVAR